MFAQDVPQKFFPMPLKAFVRPACLRQALDYLQKSLPE
jgi:hypothetical protein